jgi:hypothetical protein
MELDNLKKGTDTICYLKIELVKAGLVQLLQTLK